MSSMSPEAERLHLLMAYKAVAARKVDFLEIVATSSDAAHAIERIVDSFSVSESAANYLLTLQLFRLTTSESERMAGELAALEIRIPHP